MMKMIVHSLTKRDFNLDISMGEISYIVNVVIDSLVLDSISETKANISEKLSHDRMEGQYTDDTIDLIIHSINSMVYSSIDDTLTIDKVDFKVTVNQLNMLVIVIEIISNNKWLNRLRKDVS